MLELTPKERLFVEEYVVNGFNGKRAYMKAYNSNNENLSSTEACKLLKKQKIQDALEAEEGGFRQIARQHKLDRAAIVQKLYDLIYGTTLVKTKLGEFIEIPQDGKTINSAIVTLARLTGDFSPERKILEVENGLSDIDVTKLSKEELEELKASLLSEL